MEHETKTYFTEHEQDDVKGFTIIATDESDSKYHIAEKWLSDEGEDTWMDYWIPEAQLLARVDDGACEPKAQLTDEQYAQICELVGWDYHEGGTKVEA